MDFNDLWKVYRACLMLGTLITSAQKLRHRPKHKHESRMEKPDRPFVLGGNKWPSQTYWTNQQNNGITAD